MCPPCAASLAIQVHLLARLLQQPDEPHHLRLLQPPIQANLRRYLTLSLLQRSHDGADAPRCTALVPRAPGQQPSPPPVLDAALEREPRVKSGGTTGAVRVSAGDGTAAAERRAITARDDEIVDGREIVGRQIVELERRHIVGRCERYER